MRVLDSDRVENFCARCALSIFIGVQFEGEESRSEYFASRTAKRPVQACPQCAAALQSETVLSAAQVEWRDHARLMEQLTGLPYKPILGSLPLDTMTFSPKSRANAPMPEREVQVKLTRDKEPTGSVLAELPGVCYTQEEIAAWCGCLDGSILLIERKALKKLRNRLHFVEMIEGLFDARQPATRKEAA